MYKRFYVDKKPKKTHTYQYRPRQHNFLKYWRVVKYYIKDKYDILETELEMILFLYDENLFTRQIFNNYAKTMSWDKNRFSSMIDSGYIKKWRSRKESQRSSLYELTIKSKRICNHLYKKLMQEEIISENPYRNEIFRGKSYMDKVYKNVIKKMNSSTQSRSDE